MPEEPWERLAIINLIAAYHDHPKTVETLLERRTSAGFQSLQEADGFLSAAGHKMIAIDEYTPRPRHSHVRTKMDSTP